MNPPHNKTIHSKSSQQLTLCHFPHCECPVGAVYDFKLREFFNGTLHFYRFCQACGAVAQSSVKRTSIPLSKWRELCREGGVQQ